MPFSGTLGGAKAPCPVPSGSTYAQQNGIPRSWCTYTAERKKMVLRHVTMPVSSNDATRVVRSAEALRIECFILKYKLIREGWNMTGKADHKQARPVCCQARDMAGLVASYDQE